MGVGCVLMLVLSASLSVVYCQQKCFEGVSLREIPSDHVYHKLDHPIVIGHMGNIQRFQENSLEGIKSLIDIKAGGVHVHVRLTKDHKLILFQDDNLYRMTGEDYDVSKLPYSEIQKMSMLNTIHYYKVLDDHESEKMRTYNYESTAKIPLLASVFQELRGKNLLIYVEMMPDHIPPADPLDRHLALKTADLLLKMIKDYGMENQVLVVSRDGFKLLGLADSQPAIPLGWPIDTRLYTPRISEDVENEYYDFPPVYSNECFKKLGGKGFSFMKNLVSSGLISKVVNASFVDVSVHVYDGTTKYFDITSQQPTIKDVIASNYGGRVSFGVFDVFSWNSTDTQLSPTDQKEEDTKHISKIVAAGASRIITNNVNRVKRALDDVITPYSQGNIVHTYMTVIVLTILIGKMAVTLVYV